MFDISFVLDIVGYEDSLSCSFIAFTFSINFSTLDKFLAILIWNVKSVDFLNSGNLEAIFCKEDNPSFPTFDIVFSTDDFTSLENLEILDFIFFKIFSFNIL